MIFIFPRLQPLNTKFLLKGIDISWAGVVAALCLDFDPLLLFICNDF